jgi:hypothetical protein
MGVHKEKTMKNLQHMLTIFLPRNAFRATTGIVVTIVLLALFLVFPDLTREAIWLLLWIAWALIFRWPFQTFMVVGIVVSFVAALVALIIPLEGQHLLVLGLGFVAGGWMALLCDETED